jgi:signal transduction histidine kinase
MKAFMKRTGIRVHFTTFAGVEQLTSARRTVVYRIVQSALNNVAQHAQASRVKVNLRKIADAVQAEIADNGRFFEVERVLHSKSSKRLGLLSMRERAEMVGGSLTIDSVRGRGTTVRAQIPFGDTPTRKAWGKHPIASPRVHT